MCCRGMAVVISIVVDVEVDTGALTSVVEFEAVVVDGPAEDFERKRPVVVLERWAAECNSGKA